MKKYINNIAFKIFKKYQRIKLIILKLFNVSVVKTAYGIPITANYEDATFRFYAQGTYGFFYWDHLADIGYDFIFLDIGANQGLYAIGALLNSKCVMCYAFEPINHTAEYLNKNLELNNVSKRCQVIRKAISNSTGEESALVDNYHSGGATISPSKKTTSRSVPGPDRKRIVKIQTLNHAEISKIISNNNLPIVVKVDVEGHEYVVINELLTSNLNSRIMEIFYEVDVKWTSQKSIDNLLSKHNFVKVKRIGGINHYDILATRSKI